MGPTFPPQNSNQLKRTLVNIILSINSEILELQKEYQRLGEDPILSKKAENLENLIKEKKQNLEKSFRGVL